MTAINQNITIYAGDYLEIEIPVLNPTGGSINPVGAAAKYMVAKDLSAPVPLISKHSGDGITVSTDGPGGTMLLTIVLEPDDTADMADWGSYYHEVEIRDSEDRPFTVMTGVLTVMPAIIK